jgi:hypothetical protein
MTDPGQLGLVILPQSASAMLPFQMNGNGQHMKREEEAHCVGLVYWLLRQLSPGW